MGASEAKPGVTAQPENEEAEEADVPYQSTVGHHRQPQPSFVDNTTAYMEDGKPFTGDAQVTSVPTEKVQKAPDSEIPEAHITATEVVHIHDSAALLSTH